MREKSVKPANVITESEFESYCKRTFLPQYYGEGEEDVMKILLSHQEIFAANAKLSFENMNLKSALKQACMMISTHTPQGAAAYEKFSKECRHA